MSMLVTLLHRLILPALLLALSLPATAGEDLEGAKDHPLLSRYPDSHISEYQQNYSAVDFATDSRDGVPQRHSIEGDATQIYYFHDSAETQPSPLQLLRHYQSAIKTLGGEVIYERLPSEGDGGETTLKVLTTGKELWARVEPGIFSVPTQSYRLAIVEVAVMQQVVTAEQLLDALNRNGLIALHINFDSGKAELKTDDQATVDEIVNMLRTAPGLNIAIEGHTDNVGRPADNKSLSERRAQNVMAAIVAGGIPAARLKATGFGQERPVADNRSEDGRTKNRRIELVKQ